MNKDKQHYLRPSEVPLGKTERGFFQTTLEVPLWCKTRWQFWKMASTDFFSAIFFCNLRSPLVGKLYLLSLKNNGALLLSSEVKFTCEMIADLTGHKIAIVEQALVRFKNLI